MIRITVWASENSSDFRVETDEEIKHGEIAWAIAHLELVKRELLEILRETSNVEIGAEEVSGNGKMG